MVTPQKGKHVLLLSPFRIHQPAHERQAHVHIVTQKLGRDIRPQLTVAAVV